MKMKKNRINIVGLFALAMLCFGLNFSAPTNAQKAETSVKATPSPKQTPTAKPTITLTPIATPTATPTPTPTQYQTLAEVQAKIQTVLARPELQRGQVGIKINSLDTGKTLFEQNAEKYFMPASNMKSYTIAAAIERLSPDFKFVTSVYAAPVDASGTIKGDLTIFGRGDVSFSSAFYDGDNYKAINALADKIAQAGVKRVEGNLIGDESYFRGSAFPDGWEWDDLQWYYGAEVSALPFNDNAVELKITPNTQLGMPCITTISPPNSLVRIVNFSQTISSGEKRMISVAKKLDSNEIEISGTMPADDKGYTGNIALTKPAELFVAQLKNALQQKGIVVAGQTRVIDYKTLMQNNLPPSPARSKIVLLPLNDYVSPKEIVSFESPPLSVIAAKTLKPSQNMYTETILRELGEQYGRKQEMSLTIDADALAQINKMTSAEIGLQTVQRFLTEIGIPADSVIQHDGSGLSRHNLITPSSAVQLYTYMSKSRNANVWRDALTIAGVDGTLRNRFKNTAAADNVRGKTGTIDQVSALSGYVTTAAGERLVFSILVNGVNNSRQREAAIDEIVLALAQFKGRTN